MNAEMTTKDRPWKHAELEADQQGQLEKIERLKRVDGPRMPEALDE